MADHTTKTLAWNLVAKNKATGPLKDVEKGVEKAKEKAAHLSEAIGGVIGGYTEAASEKVAEFFKESIDGAKESIANHKVLNQELHDMGSVSAKAFKGASEWSEEYGKSIGKDGNQIVEAVSKLGTFPAAFGKGTDGADAMHRAVKAAFDLQAAGLGNAQQNVIKLGVALNDPAKGMAKLTRSGVVFTAEQQKQIKAYEKQGKLADAQRLLLQGIESNAKGAAEAQASGWDKAKATLQDTGETIAKALLPKITELGVFLNDKILPAVGKFSEWLGPKIEEAEKRLPAVETAFKNILAVITNPAFEAFAATIGTLVVAWTVYKKTLEAVKAVSEAYAAVMELIDVVMDANPFFLVIAALIALGVGFTILYKRSATFRAIVQASMHGAVAAFHWLRDAAVWVFNWVKAHWPLLAGIFTGPIGYVVGYVIKHFGQIRGAVTGTVSFIVSRFRSMGSGIKSAWNNTISWIHAVPGRIRGFFSSAGSWLKEAGRMIIRGLLQGLESAAGDVMGWLSHFASNIMGKIKHSLGISSPSKRMRYEVGQMLGEGVRLGIEDKMPAIGQSMAKIGVSSPGRGGAWAGGAGGGGDVNVYIQGGTIIGSSAEFRRTVVEAINQGTARGAKVAV